MIYIPVDIETETLIGECKVSIKKEWVKQIEYYFKIFPNIYKAEIRDFKGNLLALFQKKTFIN